ncbi:hypothetical protein QFZ76_007636 [Streptomyces sp. V4I2]|nr:hypothetical protein [Streptomyces sp. V4I2]
MPKPVQRCHEVSRSMPMRRSSQGSRATRTSWKAIRSAPYRPASRPSTMRAFDANPAWVKKKVTTATFAASTAYRPVRATTLGRIAVGGAGGDWTVVTDRAP